MKKIKALMSAMAIALVILMTGLGTLYGDVSSKLYREGGLSGGQAAAAKGNPLNADQSTFTPARTKDKSESVTESEGSRLPLKMERYKPYKEGEGQSRIR